MPRCSTRRLSFVSSRKGLGWTDVWLDETRRCLGLSVKQRSLRHGRPRFVVCYGCVLTSAPRGGRRLPINLAWPVLAPRLSGHSVFRCERPLLAESDWSPVSAFSLSAQIFCSFVCSY
jgi:hypothetical protein